jgi:lysophospholipase L1-like esterase/outer membrane lipoprotein-sorting protein
MKKRYLISIIGAALLYQGCGDRTSFDDELQNTKPQATFNQDIETTNTIAYEGKLTGSDEDNDELKYQITKEPEHGKITLKPDGLFIYEPDSGYEGEDSFEYVVSDELSTSDPKSVTITVSKPQNPHNGGALDIKKSEDLIPKKPSNIEISNEGACKLHISWQDNSDNERSFSIYVDGELKDIVDANSNSDTFCMHLEPSTKYTVSIKANNKHGSSDLLVGHIVTEDVISAPEDPQDLQIVSLSKNSARLRWRDNSDNESEFCILVNGKKVKSVKANTQTALVTGLKPGTKYSFMVVSKNRIGCSASNIVGASTKILDTIKPTIMLKGEAKVSLFVGDKYVERGAEAVDDRDGVISDKIIIDPKSIDTTKEGTYTITYRVSDKAKNEEIIIRTVEVKPIPEPIFGGEFKDFKELLYHSKKGEFKDVHYISIGDSTRAMDEGYGGGRVFKEINATLAKYHVKSTLQASPGHTLRVFNLDNLDSNETVLGKYALDKDMLYDKQNWNDLVKAISGDGNHTIVNISLGINDLRYFDGNVSKNITSQYLGGKAGDGTAGYKKVIEKIKKVKPNTKFLLTMPNRVIGFKDESGNDKSDILKEAYISVAKSLNIPLIKTMDEVKLDKDKDYRVEDASDYGSGFRIHPGKSGQKKIADLILSKILP